MSITCPYCVANAESFATACPRCGGNLAPLAALLGWAASQFNAALDAALNRKWLRAAAGLEGLLAAIPDDLEARLLAVKVYARLGDRTGMERHLSEAARRSNGLELDTLRDAAFAQVDRLLKQRTRATRKK